jgi:serine/threonine protein kinase, bacterial
MHVPAKLYLRKMIKTIDSISFELKKNYDFDWLNRYGKVFCVFDQQDSGNICFGVENENKKLFIKYAGAPTINYEGKYEDAILRMKNAIQVYKDIEHPNLIKLIEHFEQGKGYTSIFEWANGECLHAHWNFDKYPQYTHPESPNFRFNQLRLELKLDCIDKIFSLHKLVTQKGYAAIDFYDGSIMYDFETNKTTICDIDFYAKSPIINTTGRIWGSSKFMSPEEFERGAIIDEITTIFTMGALAFEILGNNQNRSIEHWKAPKKLFEIAKRATNKDRDLRYKSINDFYTAWNTALEN